MTNSFCFHFLENAEFFSLFDSWSTVLPVIEFAGDNSFLSALGSYQFTFSWPPRLSPRNPLSAGLVFSCGHCAACLWLLQDLPVLLVFKSLIVVYLGKDLFQFILISVYSASWIYRLCVLPNLEIFTLFLQIFCQAALFSFTYHDNMNVGPFYFYTTGPWGSVYFFPVVYFLSDVQIGWILLVLSSS